MELLTGTFEVTLDEKGRISLPANLRRCLDEPALYLTEGLENCLWLFSSGEFNKMINKIMNNTDSFSKNNRDIRRHIIGPAQKVELDKSGRIPIAQTLRDFAGLSKDCVVVGQIDKIEVWAEDRYREYRANSNGNFYAATEELSSTLKNKRGDSE